MMKQTTILPDKSANDNHSGGVSITDINSDVMVVIKSNRCSTTHD